MICGNFTVNTAPVQVRPVLTKADKKAFVVLPFRLYANNPNWVPPLKDEVYGLITPGKNPWFEHGEAQLFLAERGGQVVGRISAHIDALALAQPAAQGMGPGTGNWGLFEAADKEVGDALIAQAEDWLRAKGMTRSLGPLSISIWDEPGLLIDGHDHPPVVMMGYNAPEYEAWVEAWGYTHAQDLFSYEVPITEAFPSIVQRIVASGEKNPAIRIRHVNKRRFNEEAAIILGLLNDAWSDNWGFVPLTESEIAYVGKKLKPLVYEDLIRIAEVDGEAVAFIMTLPNINEQLMKYGGNLMPFNWAKLLWWLRAPKMRSMRVPLMGVAKKLHGSRLSSQLAMMMIEFVRRDAIVRYGASRGEFGWAVEDNGPMMSVAKVLGSKPNKTYRIYQKAL
jgi:GNAT superfamily N-acetyltransferase